MLGKPENGWTLFQLGSKETAYDLSYVTDVAMDWLDQALRGLQTLDVFSVHGYCEPGRMICTVSFWSCYVIFEEDGRAPACENVHHLHVNMLEFCKKLHADLSDHLESWVRWEGDAENEEETAALNARREALTEKLNRLKALIEEREEDFSEGCCFI